MTKLYLHLPSYNLKCQYKEIKIEELIKYADKVNIRYGTDTLFEQVKSIEPQVFDSKYRITFKEFLKITQKHHKDLRKYNILFHGEHFKGDAYACLGLKVTLRSKYGDKDDKEKCLAAGRNEAQHKTGADLAIIAFNKQNGCLNPPWPIATEAQQGVQLMFQGFFMYLRNAFAHNVVVMGEDKSSVFECISTCEFLLNIIEKSTVR